MAVLLKLAQILACIAITAALPVYFLNIFVCYTYFGFVNLLAKCFRKDFAYCVRRIDAYLSSDNTKKKPSSTLVHVTVLKGSPSEETVIQHLEQLYESRSTVDGSRMHEKLGFSLERWMGYSFWKKIHDFRIKNYVHFIQTKEQLDREGIGGFVETVIRAPIKKGTPLWEVFVLYPPNSGNKYRKQKLCDRDGDGNTGDWSKKFKQEGKDIEELQKDEDEGFDEIGECVQNLDSKVTGSTNCDEGECFIVFKTHHMLLDGMSLVKLWYKADGAAQLPSNLRNVKTSEKGNEGEGIKLKNWEFVKLLFITPYLCNRFVTPHDDSYFMKQYKNLNGDWFCSGINKVYVERYRDHLRKLGFTLTHTILVAYTRGFRRFLQGNYSPSQIPPKIHIIGSIPAPNCPNHPDNTLENHWAVMRYKAVLSANEIKYELQKAKDEYAVAVRSLIPQSFFLLSGVYEKLPRKIFDTTFDERKHATLTLSNIPGPQTEQMMFNLPVSDRMVWLPLVKHSSGIGLLFLTYNGWGNISLTADKGLIKSRKLFEELNSFIALEMQVVLDEVERMAVNMDLSTSSPVESDTLFEVKVVK